jgi:LPXTG-motif cell wall-anchored protein
VHVHLLQFALGTPGCFLKAAGADKNEEPNAGSIAGPKSCSSSTSTSTSAGVIAGGIIGALLLGGLIFFVFKRRKQQEGNTHSMMLASKLDEPLLTNNQGGVEMQIGSATPSGANFAAVSSSTSPTDVRNEIAECHAVNELPFAQIATITNNKAQILGEGGFATVYKGVFYRQDVAVKIDKEMNEDMQKYTAQQFVAEIHTLYKYKHDNLCMLLAHSIDGPSRCLM